MTPTIQEVGRVIFALTFVLCQAIFFGLVYFPHAILAREFCSTQPHLISKMNEGGPQAALDTVAK